MHRSRSQDTHTHTGAHAERAPELTLTHLTLGKVETRDSGFSSALAQLRLSSFLPICIYKALKRHMLPINNCTHAGSTRIHAYRAIKHATYRRIMPAFAFPYARFYYDSGAVSAKRETSSPSPVSILPKGELTVMQKNVNYSISFSKTQPRRCKTAVGEKRIKLCSSADQLDCLSFSASSDYTADKRLFISVQCLLQCPHGHHKIYTSTFSLILYILYYNINIRIRHLL